MRRADRSAAARSSPQIPSAPLASPAPLTLLTALALLAALTLLPLPAAATPETHRIAVIVGNDVGADGEERLSFAEAEAEELMEVLQHVGGVDPEWSYLLLGLTAPEVRRAFADVRERIADIGSRGRVTLLVYYSGHADARALHLDDTRLELAELKAFVTDSGAQVSVAVVDACYSGGLARHKGARRGPPMAIRTLHPDAGADVRGHVIITSSGPEELSQETDAVRGSYFSHYLISGLRGAADLSQDGRVTLAELYQFTYARTLTRTFEAAAGPQHATREVDLRGAGDVVLTRPVKSRAAILFPRGLEGTYFVVRKRSEALVAEVGLDGEPVRLALPADTYLVRTRGASEIRVAQVNLSWGGEHRFDPSSMRNYPVVRATPRGMPDPSPHRLALLAGARSGSVSGLPALPAAALQYTWTRDLVAVGGQLSYGAWSFRAVDTDVFNHEAQLLGFVGARLLRAPVELLVGLDLGGRWVYQQVAGVPDHSTLGALLEASGRILVPVLDPFMLVVDTGIGATAFDVYDRGWEPRLSWRAAVGVGAQL